jgi:O-antigen/teichoic acid export membrane protein
MAVLCVASGAFIEVFLSERWLPVAAMFAVLAPIGALQAITGLNGPLLMATGRTDLRLRLTWEFTALWVIAVPLLALCGLMAVAIGFAVIYLLYLPRLLQLFLKPIEGRIADYLRAISIPLVVSVALAATHLTVKTILAGIPPWVEISFAVSEVLIGYGVAAWALRGRLMDDLRTVQMLFVRRPLHAAAVPNASSVPLLQNKR